MENMIENCPCNGKGSSNFAAPWILLTLYKSEGMHGYALAEVIRKRLEEFGFGLNIAGVYRHLAAMENRGMLISEIDPGKRGVSRKRYKLTDSGASCLHNWIGTMQSQAGIIQAFFDLAEKKVPDHFFTPKD